MCTSSQWVAWVAWLRVTEVGFAGDLGGIEGNRHQVTMPMAGILTTTTLQPSKAAIERRGHGLKYSPCKLVADRAVLGPRIQRGVQVG